MIYLRRFEPYLRPGDSYTLVLVAAWRPPCRSLLQFVTGVWLMYCTYAINVDLALGAKAWV
jgi:hypothetical protein